MQTKAATGADSMGIMIDDTSLERWEPLLLSSGEDGKTESLGSKMPRDGCQEWRQPGGEAGKEHEMEG